MPLQTFSCSKPAEQNAKTNRLPNKPPILHCSRPSSCGEFPRCSPYLGEPISIFNIIINSMSAATCL
jgi:hypothetical protein